MKTFELPPVVLTPVGRIAAAILELLRGSSCGELKPQAVLCRVESGKRRLLPRR